MTFDLSKQVSERRALALRSFKEEAVLARVVRYPPTLTSMNVISTAVFMNADC